MNKTTKIWLILASSLLFTGLIIFSTVMSLLNWDFTKLSTSKYQATTQEVTEDFTNIYINVDTADIEFFYTTDSKITVTTSEYENSTHLIKVEDNTLKIQTTDNRKWYEHISLFSLKSPKVSVYLPFGNYEKLSIISDTGDVKMPNDLNFSSIDIVSDTGDVINYASATEYIKIQTTTGDVRLEKISTNEITIIVSTGDVKAKDVACKTFTSNGNTGDISLINVIVRENLTILRSTGDVEFHRCNADNIEVETDTGDVEGSFVSSKIFITKTSTGDVDVPKTTSGGICKITTSTGDIEIDIRP